MILIKNATIVTQGKKRQIIKNGAVVIGGDRILEVGDSKKIEKKYKNKAHTIIEGEGKVVMPGLINTHTHLAMTLLRGYADDMPLEKWWFERVFPFESKLRGEDIYWGSLLGGLEMIKSGTTYFVDFYFFADHIAQAVEELGIRANIGIPIMDLKTPEFKNPDEALKSVSTTVAKWRKYNLIKFSLAPHVLQTTSLETYKKCKKLANQYKIILQTHLAETKQEIKYCLKKYQKSPVELLIGNKILDKNSLAAHCCHLNDKEIKLLAKNKVNISHCSVSNMKLASGIMPLSKLLKAGVNIGLGTDGACSNNNLDMFEEMKIASLLHKLIEKKPTIADAQTILDMATINGARALGLENEIGSIEKDKKADLIILNLNQPHLLPCYNIVSHLVYAAKGSDVETVIINGKIIMMNKKVLTVDEGGILEKIRTSYFGGTT